MGLEKAILHGKEHRAPYRDSRRFDRTCRNHGTCQFCERGRQRDKQLREIEARDAMLTAARRSSPTKSRITGSGEAEP